LVNPNTVLSFGGWVRRDDYNYYPSADPFADLTPDLQLESVGQHRTLTNAGIRGDVDFAKGPHTLKAGVVFQHTFLSEDDSLGIVDPTANPVCLASGGSPDTDPALTNPANCAAPLQPNPNFNPLLACYDLTRTASLPASDGCPNPTSGLYAFLGHADVKELALFAQDTLKVHNWQFNLGVRGDLYNGLTIAREIEPRLGVAYKIKPTSTVLRASYARTLETPFNENLVLASEGCKDSVIAAIMATSTPCVTNAPVTPGKRNEFHAGLEQAFGKYLVVDGEYIWKYTQGGYDFSILGNTPIAFPIEWTKSKIPGYALRVSVPETHGFTAYTVMSSVAARFFEPQIAGIGAVPSGAGGVFRIDHDEAFNQTTHLQYQPFKRGPWIGFNWRYDSGLVAGPVPCAGGNCANGPNGTDSIVDTSIITPDQQFQAGLACNGVFATPTTPISPNNLCPANEYTSKYVRIPAPDTEDNDHNPPRIAPRHLFDLSVGEDNLFNGDKHKWSLRLSAINLTNKEALYNFLSTFSGTHYVTPRALTVELGFHF
jgi:outer membrane receptor protein involved in Fe transport